MQWLIGWSYTPGRPREDRGEMASQETSEERDELLAAVRGLTEEVRGIHERLDTIYAPRAEVTREGRRRAWRFLALAIVIILISQMMTMTTISYCFLSANVHGGPFCSAMPGYSQAIDQNSIRLARFEALLDGIEATQKNVKANDAQIDDLNRRLKVLEGQKNG
jgi:hypothetical protein